ncbi:MAG: 2-oxoacid:acceptor oxidoreductase family protein [Oscillospiraceae bacterium]|nr:2-oxoacid:acceptor oxidoreductase family protein [Oscillospiraceae bacterium]
MEYNMVVAGFGGQGVLFAGKFLTYVGMLGGRNVSWLPSYGPEMRGGTANCSVIISDRPVGSPIVLKPDVLIAMNLPSYDKFEPLAAPGALVLVDTSRITREAARGDVTTFMLPAARMAEENGLNGLANMILAGMLIGKTGLCTDEEARQALIKTIPPRKAELLEKNMTAIMLGKNA